MIYLIRDTWALKSIPERSVIHLVRSTEWVTGCDQFPKRIYSSKPPEMLRGPCWCHRSEIIRGVIVSCGTQGEGTFLIFKSLRRKAHSEELGRMRSQKAQRCTKHRLTHNNQFQCISEIDHSQSDRWLDPLRCVWVKSNNGLSRTKPIFQPSDSNGLSRTVKMEHLARCRRKILSLGGLSRTLELRILVAAGGKFCFWGNILIKKRISRCFCWHMKRCEVREES